MFDFIRIEKFNFKILDQKYAGSGIYIMSFPNGMKYLGKSKHINKRIRQHFLDFSNASDWHAAARSTFTKYKLPQFNLKLQDEYNRIRYKMACDFFHKIKLYIWEVPEDKITWAEDSCLNQIQIENNQSKFYNSQYPKEGLECSDYIYG